MSESRTLHSGVLSSRAPLKAFNQLPLEGEDQKEKKSKKVRKHTTKQAWGPCAMADP